MNNINKPKHYLLMCYKNMLLLIFLIKFSNAFSKKVYFKIFWKKLIIFMKFIKSCKDLKKLT